jgi:hypothetical protein
MNEADLARADQGAQLNRVAPSVTDDRGEAERGQELPAQDAHRLDQYLDPGRP